MLREDNWGHELVYSSHLCYWSISTKGVFLSHARDVPNMFLQMKWYGTLFANNHNNVRGVPRFEVVQKESRWRTYYLFFHIHFFLHLTYFPKITQYKWNAWMFYGGGGTLQIVNAVPYSFINQSFWCKFDSWETQELLSVEFPFPPSLFN